MAIVLCYHSRQNKSLDLEVDKLNNVFHFLCIPIMNATWETIKKIK